MGGVQFQDEQFYVKVNEFLFATCEQKKKKMIISVAVIRY